MNIQHPTEQANRPATGVVTDKGVPQSDSFAKYAAAFLRNSRFTRITRDLAGESNPVILPFV
ncbi:hypothetical protein AN696_0227325 [Enterobacter asburiae]|uniref:Uncharacterized protein n=1 Tax=Enterobacter asburiae TaxID=61645 RepID=A0AB36FF39_ENTAS|nr:hypothetical protein AN696_0227325 [Enterobacter asburiae]